ncbi:hypothetical protein AB3Z07_03425 [Metabacillus halosaccharovorans]|uniref:hypothetical protein n=1 Tax=Metabacillus halosaccharovorans TaxID=930124 RepID=UPI0034D01FF8
MKRILYKSLAYFLGFFICNLIINAIFKPSLNVLTAFSVALGTSLGIAFVEHYIAKRSTGK